MDKFNNKLINAVSICQRAISMGNFRIGFTFCQSNFVDFQWKIAISWMCAYMKQHARSVSQTRIETHVETVESAISHRMTKRVAFVNTSVISIVKTKSYSSCTFRDWRLPIEKLIDGIRCEHKVHCWYDVQHALDDKNKNYGKRIYSFLMGNKSKRVFISLKLSTGKKRNLNFIHWNESTRGTWCYWMQQQQTSLSKSERMKASTQKACLINSIWALMIFRNVFWLISSALDSTRSFIHFEWRALLTAAKKKKWAHEKKSITHEKKNGGRTIINNRTKRDSSSCLLPVFSSSVLNSQTIIIRSLVSVIFSRLLLFFPVRLVYWLNNFYCIIWCTNGKKLQFNAFRLFCVIFSHARPNIFLASKNICSIMSFCLL